MPASPARGGGRLVLLSQKVADAGGFALARIC